MDGGIIPAEDSIVEKDKYDISTLVNFWKASEPIILEGLKKHEEEMWRDFYDERKWNKK